MLPEVRSDLHALLQGDLDELAADARRLLEMQVKRDAHAYKAQIEYESIPNSDTIAEVAEMRAASKGRALQPAGYGRSYQSRY